MINIAICDDIEEELEIISHYVSKKLKELNISFKISSFSEGQDLIDHISSAKELEDIIFLDIYMKFSNGIDIARKIREFDKECKIIFVSSSKDYAIDSYDVSAFYYILKPVNEEKLSNVIKIAIEALNKENKQIIIKNRKGTYRIYYKDILYAESKARVVNIYLKSGEVISFYSKLDDFIQSLEDERFFKCHKSFLVNMNHILKIENANIFIGNDTTIPISSSNIVAIKERYYNYLLEEM
ncbi:LytR/AlgR family response regulator transcription factor [Clostridium hydrogenum]|uniref:LytR/AlgR family response regulator transcription factor n=1 Tax=Clostridium hydrogenum TaxID=2855764 RepID=UPI001F2EDE36|nr:LytTR family DNA-binding domain-containing protein [Clostridium hydrogenum]